LTQKRQIIYAWNYREWGGAQIYFMSLMKEAKKVYEVSVLLPANSERKLLDYLAVIDVPISFLPPVEPLPWASGVFARLSRSLAHVRSENRMLRAMSPIDRLSEPIIHIDLGFWQSLSTLIRLCRRAHVFTTVHTGLPLFTGLRGLRWKVKGLIISRFQEFHLMASNAEARESLRPYVTKERFEQVEVAYSGFDAAEIERALANKQAGEILRQKFRLPADAAVLITVGQFIERKGCWVLLESLRRLKSDGHKFVFLWLATTAPAPDVMERINQHGLGESFRVVGGDEIGDTRDDLLSLMSLADIFVLASLQEGLPVALVEAMALGLSCIATSVNAIPEAIAHNENGILVPPNEPAKLAEAITDLLNDHEKRKQFGIAAKRTAYERFDERITAEKTLKLYDAIWKTGS
jgi:glycosyltransferase involved in cell wall biosynthesis